MICLILVALMWLGKVIYLRRQLGKPLNHQQLRPGRYYEVVGQCLTDEDDETQLALVALKLFKPHYGPARVYRFPSIFPSGVKFVWVYRNGYDGKIAVKPYIP